MNSPISTRPSILFLFSDYTDPGLDLLSDGTFVATTYIQYQPDELQSIVSVRFRLDEMEQRRMP